MAEIEFKLQHLDKYGILNKPCTAEVIVASEVKVDNIMDEIVYPRWIVNLRVITSSNLRIIKDLVLTEDLFYSDVGHLLMSGAIWQNQIHNPEVLPKKGERVIASFDYVEGVLRCTNITLIPREELKIFISDEQLGNILSEFKTIIDNE